MGGTYQVDEGEELPAAAVGLVRRHVQGAVVAQDGEVGEQDGDPQNLRRDQRHDEGFGGELKLRVLLPAGRPGLPVRSDCTCTGTVPSVEELELELLLRLLLLRPYFRVMMTTQRGAEPRELEDD